MATKEIDVTKLSDRCDEVSRILKALSHPVRLKTLCALVESEKTVGELVEFGEISQSAMSQFLARLKEEGVVRARKEGTFVYYSIQDPRLSRLVLALKEIFCR